MTAMQERSMTCERHMRNVKLFVCSVSVVAFISTCRPADEETAATSEPTSPQQISPERPPAAPAEMATEKTIAPSPETMSPKTTPAPPETTASSPAPVEDVPLAIHSVSLSAPFFNPTVGQTVALSYELTRPCQVTLTVFDADQSVVRKLAENGQRMKGRHEEVWDGKNPDGYIVPDEAYFFTIVAREEGGTEAVYDPTTFSGGESGDITTADIDRENNTVNYALPKPARVRVRVGLRQGGPMLGTLADWVPRVSGSNTEFWHGKDQDRLVDLHDHEDFAMIITYVTLPETSVITVGNKSVDYRGYKLSVAGDRPRKPERQRVATAKSSPHYGQPRASDRAPRLQMTFPRAEKDSSTGLPVLQDRPLVRVEVTDVEDLRYLNDRGFELLFFLDWQFHAEAEEGRSPYNWVWDVGKVPPGKHILTVNVISARDQVGVASREVLVVVADAQNDRAPVTKPE